MRERDGYAQGIDKSITLIVDDGFPPLRNHSTLLTEEPCSAVALGQPTSPIGTQ